MRSCQRYPRTKLPAMSDHPSATTKNASLKGKDTIAGGTIIMPILISTAATTRSIIRNGRKIRNPTWNAREISDSKKLGMRMDKGAPATSEISSSCLSAEISWNVSRSRRAAMNFLKGSIDAANADSASISSLMKGCTPFCQAVMKTGSITKYVKNNARLIRRRLGGACCNPIACRSIDNTVTINGKHVIVTRIPGAMLNSVIRANSCIALEEIEPFSSSEIETPCEKAAPEDRSASAAPINETRSKI